MANLIIKPKDFFEKVDVIRAKVLNVSNPDSVDDFISDIDQLFDEYESQNEGDLDGDVDYQQNEDDEF